MIIQSKYTKIFHSNGLTRQKYDELHDFAVLIQNHKNTVSQHVNSHLLYYLDYNKFQFIKVMRERFKDVISSSFDAQLYTQVFTCYQNKFDAIQRKLVFETKTFKGFEFYKRDTKKHKKGDLKKVVCDNKQTPLSNCLTYLARYGNESTIDYINSNIGSCDENKREFYNNIVRCCEKYGFERLHKLALSKRKRIVKHYSEHPIEFKTLTFSGRCRKTRIIDYNSKFGSVINSFVSLSGISRSKGRKSFDIPVHPCPLYGRRDIRRYHPEVNRSHRAAQNRQPRYQFPWKSGLFPSPRTLSCRQEFPGTGAPYPRPGGRFRYHCRCGNGILPPARYGRLPYARACGVPRTPRYPLPDNTPSAYHTSGI